jgi:hypothetical protein
VEAAINFFLKNWGNLASVIGSVLTVYYARSALSAANLAKQASLEAKSRIYAIDWVLQFSEVVANIDSLLIHVGEQTDWQRVSADCTRLRSQAAVAYNDPRAVADDTWRKKLQQSPTQFSNIATIADTFSQDAEKLPDKVRIRKILSSQRELFSICLEQAKQSAAGSLKHD